MAKVRKARKTRVNTGRKRSSYEERLLREVAQLRAELLETDLLRERMSRILRRTADALHGGPLENGYWSWHDLPELARTLRDKAYSDIESLIHIQPSTPFFSTMPKTRAGGVTHQWVHDALRPYTQWDRTLDQISWWWRKPWGWLLSLRKWWSR